MKKGEYIKFLIDYVEGRVPFLDFWEKLNNDKALWDLLVNNKKRNKSDKKSGYPKYIYEKLSIDDVFNRYHILCTVNNFLITNKKKFNCNNNVDIKKVSLYLKMVPRWVRITDEKYLDSLYESAPKDLRKPEKLKWCKQEILKIYKYDKKPPTWVQEPEWPLDENNNPLIFKKQKIDKDDNERMIYYFYDKNGKETITEQYY